MSRKMKKPCCMMATKAFHKLGNTSRDRPSLCIISAEEKENYIGNWADQFGFFEVMFPKKTTRSLTEEEKEHYRKHIDNRIMM